VTNMAVTPVDPP